MRFSTTAILIGSALAGLSSAVTWDGPAGYTGPPYTKPEGDAPFLGNPTSFPAVKDILPKGQASNVKWSATTTGTVTIMLYIGPSTNLKPLYPIATKIDNSGTFAWTPKEDLVDQTTHYGLQIIDDATGKYQWSPRFGISGGNTTPGPSDVSSASAPAATVPAAASYTAVPPVVSQITDGQPQAPKASGAKYSYITTQMTTTICPTATAPAATAPAATSPAAAASYPVAPAPPASVPAPSASAPAGTAPAPATTSPIVGAAGKNMVATGAVFAAFLAAFAL